MAKGIPSNSTIKRGEMRPSPVVEGLDFAYPVLMDCSLNWSSNPENPSDEKPERFYDCGLRFAEDAMKETELSPALCFFSAGQKIKDEKIFEVRAIYVVAVKLSGKNGATNKADIKKLLEEIAGTAAWPLFRTLFAQICSQATRDLPFLPALPKLRWFTPDKMGTKKEEEKT